MKRFRIRYLLGNDYRFKDLGTIEGRDLIEVSQRAKEEIRRKVGEQPVVTIRMEVPPCLP